MEAPSQGNNPRTLIWAKNQRSTLFGHLLAQKITANRSIDPTDGVEPIESSRPATSFCGEVVIEAKRKALERAKRYRAGIVMWTEGSKLSQ